MMYNSVMQYLEKTYKLFPEKVAFKEGEKNISFMELRANSFKIAEFLIEKDLRKKPILIFMDKSINMVLTFYGVAYSGNFYTPIDTKMPHERIKRIIAKLKPSVILTDRKNYDYISANEEASNIFVVDELLENTVVNEFSVITTMNKIVDTDILYVFFTSGSTGTPKGVIINHRAVIDFIDWISCCYDFTEKTIFANQAQLYFDVSIQDVYAPIRNGSTTILISNRTYVAPVRVWDIIVSNNVNTLVWVPSMLSLFANMDILAHVDKANLKTVLFCGEVMPTKQLNYWINEYPDVLYVNLYGPTECTEACTYYNVDRIFKDDESLPIGKACDNCEIIVLDKDNLEVKEVGSVGELCVRGTSLSMGYYGELEKTELVFVQNPLNSDYKELIYKTGDLVKYNKYGELVFLGRKDNQIKRRGYRIELGEIESVVNSVSGIDYSCCLFDEPKDRLILIYTGNVSEEVLKDALVKRIQDYMLPNEYHCVNEMLFNQNGKVDRKELTRIYCK